MTFRAAIILALALLLCSGCEPPFPIGPGCRNVVLDFPVIETHWVPDPKFPNCGTLYAIGRGSESDLHRHKAHFTTFLSPVTDPRFQHTICTKAWWTPPASPSIVLGRATIDEQSKSPDAQAEYEFVITGDSKYIYYEQRTLPLRTSNIATNSAESEMDSHSAQSE